MVVSLQKQISQGIRSARLGRRLSQAELAQKLEISQSRLSEIEQGKGSITAEQFIVLLQFFNLPISHFVEQKNISIDDQLQNRLIQLGASQLRAKEPVLASEKLANMQSVVVEILTYATSQRLILGLIPVLILDATPVDIMRIGMQLDKLGYKHRLFWLIDGILNALNLYLKKYIPREKKILYQKAQFKLNRVRETWFQDNPIEDVLDSNISSQKTLNQIYSSRDALAKKWNVVTRITQEDFNNVLLEMEKM